MAVLAVEGAAVVTVETVGAALPADDVGEGLCVVIDAGALGDCLLWVPGKTIDPVALTSVAAPRALVLIHFGGVLIVLLLGLGMDGAVLGVLRLGLEVVVGALDPVVLVPVPALDPVALNPVAALDCAMAVILGLGLVVDVGPLDPVALNPVATLDPVTGLDTVALDPVATLNRAMALILGLGLEVDVVNLDPVALNPVTVLDPVALVPVAALDCAVALVLGLGLEVDIGALDPVAALVRAVALVLGPGLEVDVGALDLVALNPVALDLVAVINPIALDPVAALGYAVALVVQVLGLWRISSCDSLDINLGVDGVALWVLGLGLESDVGRSPSLAPDHAVALVVQVLGLWRVSSCDGLLHGTICT